MQQPMGPDTIQDAARSQSMEEALAMWELATSEVARSDDWIAVAFAIARQSRSGNA